MAGTLDTFYFDGTSFAQATSIYTNDTLTTLAPDGYYSNEVLVRQQLNGILLTASTCTTCAAPCGSGVAANFSGPGVASLDVNVGTDIGAIIIYGTYGGSLPDGQLGTYNSQTYNRLTCVNNHNTVTLQEQNGTVVDYAGLNNQGTGLPTWVGSRSTDPTGNQTSIPNLVYSYTANNFVATGTTQNYSVASTQVGTTSNSPSSTVFTMVVPKTQATVTNFNVTVFGNDFGSNTIWNVRVNCPIQLPSFQGSNLTTNSTPPTSCLALSTPYYFAVNATALNTPKTNTVPELGNFVFADANGSTYINDTSVIEYMNISGNVVLGIRNGVVVSTGTCSPPAGRTNFLASSTQTFNQICGSQAPPSTPNLSYWHDGTGSYPAVGDIVYTAQTGQALAAAGYYFLFSGGGNNHYFRINNSLGEVTESTNCNAPTP